MNREGKRGEREKKEGQGEADKKGPLQAVPSE